MTAAKARRSFILARVAEKLSSAGSQWKVDGDRVVSQGTPSVILADHEEYGEEHVDLGFELNRDHPQAPTIWDCATGFGATTEEVLSRAVETWFTCTAAVVLEFLRQDGSFATHHPEDDPAGIPGWHTIHGPFVAFGDDEGTDILLRWALEHTVLPSLANVLVRAFDRPQLNGVKFLFGNDVAEVRINGRAHDEASDALNALKWPRLERPAFVRFFVLAVHA